MMNERTLGAPLNEAEAFTRFIEALRIAEASAKQLAFVREQPAWLSVENALAQVRLSATTLAVASPVPWNGMVG